jgi:hypothetical protein
MTPPSFVHSTPVAGNQNKNAPEHRRELSHLGKESSPLTTCRLPRHRRYFWRRGGRASDTAEGNTETFHLLLRLTENSDGRRHHQQPASLPMSTQSGIDVVRRPESGISNTATVAICQRGIRIICPRHKLRLPRRGATCHRDQCTHSLIYRPIATLPFHLLYIK